MRDMAFTKVPQVLHSHQLAQEHTWQFCKAAPSPPPCPEVLKPDTIIRPKLASSDKKQNDSLASHKTCLFLQQFHLADSNLQSSHNCVPFFPAVPQQLLSGIPFLHASACTSQHPSLRCTKNAITSVSDTTIEDAFEFWSKSVDLHIYSLPCYTCSR